MPNQIQIAPSIVSAPLLELAPLLDQLKQAQIELLHIDIEDGHFVPLINLGTKFIEDLQHSGFHLDVHLMVDNPAEIIPLAIQAGAGTVSFHWEASPYPRRHLRHIRDAGRLAGLAFNPKTAWPDLDYLAGYLDLLILLTTEPEGPDCPFLPAVLDKVSQAAQWAQAQDHPIRIVVDGGVSAETIAALRQAGADRAVVGRALFGGPDLQSTLSQLIAASSS